MQLTESQNDALAELINIAFSRTAASLSDMTHHRVSLDVPQVAVHPLNELYTALAQFVQGDITTVHQAFSGKLAGDALLLLDYEGALMLTYLLTDETASPKRLDASAREVLTEVGNILLNACLGMFGNLLQVHISFSVPRLHSDSLESVIRTLVSGREGLRYALVVHTGFRLRDGAINGYLVIVLGVASLDRLIKAVEHWEDRLGQTDE